MPEPGSELHRFELARLSQDWHRLLAMADEARADGDASDELRATIDLYAGTALFMLGRSSASLVEFEAGLASPTLPDIDRAMAMYHAGMAAMITGDLGRARSHLQTAVEETADGRWPHDAAVRGLAQMEGELGRFDEGLAILAERPTAANRSFTHVIRARLLARSGRHADALEEVTSALPRITRDVGPAVPDPAVRTLASLIVAAARVYNELGMPREALPLLDRADALFERSGNPAIETRLDAKIVRAGALRMGGSLDEAEAVVERAGWIPAEAPALAELIRERARIAFDRGDTARADALWSEAASAFDSLGLAWLAADTRRELDDGPPRERTAPLDDGPPRERTAPLDDGPRERSAPPEAESDLPAGAGADAAHER